MRRLALLGVLAGANLLSACGFTPMYGETGVSGGLSRIAVTTPDDRLGYRLREQLEDAFGRDGAQAPLYRLATEGKWENDWQVALFPASLARQSVGTPQILIHPDGEITPFTLHIRSRNNNRLLFTLASTGGLPLVLTRGESR